MDFKQKVETDSRPLSVAYGPHRIWLAGIVKPSDRHFSIAPRDAGVTVDASDVETIVPEQASEES
jgi:hypothetical protein